MKPLRILTLSPVFPAPLNTGTRVRLYNLLRCLHAAGHELGFISFITPEEEARVPERASLFAEMRLVPIHRPASRWQKIVRAARVLPRLACGMPPAAAFAAHPAIRAAVTELAPRYDALCVEFYFMAANVPAGLPGGTWPLCVLVEHDLSFVPLMRRAALTPGLPGLVARLAARGARAVECAVLRRFAHIIAMSAHDAALITGINPAATVSVIPNGVDCTVFRPTQATRQATCAPRLLFAGGLAHYPNLDAARYVTAEIWPRVRAAFPAATLIITGSTQGVDTAALRVPGVELTGFVPDISHMYATSDVVICPYRIGGGTRLKILEALASGVPLVSTAIGAEGIALNHEAHALIADSPAAFAAAIIRLCRDGGLASRLAANGRTLAESVYDWPRIAAALTHTLEQGAHHVRVS